MTGANKTMEQYAIYLRKSRKDDEVEAHGEGDTLARHEQTLLNLAHNHKPSPLYIGHIFKEVVSGDTIDARPEMQRLLEEVDKGIWAGVLVMEVERLARGDARDQGRVAQAFKYSETLIITPNKTFDPTNEFDEEYFEFGLFMSRRELKTITRRLQRGRITSVEQGKYPGNCPPYGYTRIKLEKEKGWTLKEIPSEADIVRSIYEWYTVGELLPDGTTQRIGVTLIARKLNKMGVRPQRGDTWTSSSIRDILINPHYAGWVRWFWRPAKKKMVDGEIEIHRPRSDSDNVIIEKGLHEPIIEQSVFDLAQEFIKTNPVKPRKENNVLKNPWAGIIVCGKCGRNMSRRPHGNNGYPDTLLCQHIDCKNVSSQLALVEKAILDELAEILQDYKLQWETGDKSTNKKKPKSNVKQKAINKLEKELVQLDNQRKKAHDLLEREIYTTETFIQRMREITEAKQQAEESLSALVEELELEAAREQAVSLIIPTVETILEVYHELPTAQAKNELMREVLDKVVYTKDKGGRWGKPDDFTITIYTKLPIKSL